MQIASYQDCNCKLKLRQFVVYREVELNFKQLENFNYIWASRSFQVEHFKKHKLARFSLSLKDTKNFPPRRHLAEFHLNKINYRCTRHLARLPPSSWIVYCFISASCFHKLTRPADTEKEPRCDQTRQARSLTGNYKRLEGAEHISHWRQQLKFLLLLGGNENSSSQRQPKALQGFYHGRSNFRLFAPPKNFSRPANPFLNESHDSGSPLKSVGRGKSFIV